MQDEIEPSYLPKVLWQINYRLAQRGGEVLDCALMLFGEARAAPRDVDACLAHPKQFEIDIRRSGFKYAIFLADDLHRFNDYFRVRQPGCRDGLAPRVHSITPLPLQGVVQWLCLAHLGAIIRTSEHFHVLSTLLCLSVRMFGSGGKKRANASSNCAAL